MKHQLWEVDEDYKLVRLVKEEITTSVSKPEGFTKGYHWVTGDYYMSDTDEETIFLYKITK